MTILNTIRHLVEHSQVWFNDADKAAHVAAVEASELDSLPSRVATLEAIVASLQLQLRQPAPAPMPVPLVPEGPPPAPMPYQMFPDAAPFVPPSAPPSGTMGTPPVPNVAPQEPQQ